VLDVPAGGAATGVTLAYCRRSIIVHPVHAMTEMQAMHARASHTAR
jgi:hypothetical protein